MEAGQAFLLFVIFLLAVFVLVALAKAVRIVPQARAGIVERLGRYQRTLSPGLAVVVPFIDRVLPMVDLREQVVSFPPQPVITQDNLVVSIDTVVYYQVTDPKAATYEIANYIQGIEQLSVTTLRNVIGGMDLERTLTSREEINSALRGVLDDATGKWGIRVNRVELKAIDPPPSIQDSMEKQMRADRDKRAAILTAEGSRQSQILTAEGEKQSAILSAEGDKQAQILRAEADKQAQILKADGEAKAIGAVFNAIHQGKPDQKLLSYQYLQMMPEIAKGDANKVWIVPSEIGAALEGLGQAAGKFGSTFPGSGFPGHGAEGDGDTEGSERDEDGAMPGAAVADEVHDAASDAAAEGEAAVTAAQDEVRAALKAAEAASRGRSTSPEDVAAETGETDPGGQGPGHPPEPPPVPRPPES
ncbi:SPFH/Band 7/PHB domain protein [Actinobacteria bacterium YIM 96077]|uniref:SPFH/Band 7/PHB domain protein n=1 Tax=Phytoactinopolyspora halophila TaxID=1981511 RepID=A0A329QM66_9ACTN|nr:SPFH domain-containing protein [Phytoactinopolyspora halophila]AYY12982.1 SPFH/Band 7/PHB domain protein [Actinobacteria bacterium YIM 96077]RAW13246.1 SPFH/Band 7/PHB domain protein [Phytoactinopolyspora halophila]